MRRYGTPATNRTIALAVVALTVAVIVVLLFSAVAKAGPARAHHDDGGSTWEAHYGECQWWNAGAVLRSYSDGYVICNAADFRVWWVIGNTAHNVGS